MEVSGQYHAPGDLPPEKNPGTQRVVGLVDPRAGLDDLEQRQRTKHKVSYTNSSALRAWVIRCLSIISESWVDCNGHHILRIL
jgi:hypothetical protein